MVRRCRGRPARATPQGSQEGSREVAPGRRSPCLFRAGHTPLFYLSSACAFVKAEWCNPSGSMKDRTAEYLLNWGLSHGNVAPGGTVVECTSGNLGYALARRAPSLGLKFVAVLSEGTAPEKISRIRELGAEVIAVPQVEGGRFGEVTLADMRAVFKAANAEAWRRGAWFPNQFTHGACVLAQAGLGQELLEQLPGRPDRFLACVGSGATFLGVSRALRGRWPDLPCFVVEPEGCEFMAKKMARVRGTELAACPSNGGHWHQIPGISYGVWPPHLPRAADAEVLFASAPWYGPDFEVGGHYVGSSTKACLVVAARMGGTSVVVGAD